MAASDFPPHRSLLWNLSLFLSNRLIDARAALLVLQGSENWAATLLVGEGADHMGSDMQTNLLKYLQV